MSSDFDPGIITAAGEYDFEQMELLLADGESVDLTNQVESLVVYEDIYSPIMTGKLVLRDTYSIPNIAVMQGRDLLQFTVKTKKLPGAVDITPSMYYSKPELSGIFHIFKHAEIENVSDRTRTYEFHFQSIVGFANMNIVTGKSYSGNPAGLIKNIFNQYFPKETYNRELYTSYPEPNRIVKMTSNMWQPIKVISYLTKSSMGPDNDVFFFYEGKNAFNFRSLYDIRSKGQTTGEKMAFSDNDYSMNVQGEDQGMSSGRISRTPEMDYRKIQAFRVDTVFDYLSSAQDGQISSVMASYDILNKKISTSNFRYTMRNAYDSAAINTKPLWTENTISKTPPTRFFGIRNYVNVTDRYPVSLDDISHIREGMIKGINSSKIEIDVFGRLQYEIGDTVTVNISLSAPITRQNDEDSTKDKLLSGNYFITAISHRFTRDAYRATLELSRESKNL